MGARFAAAAVSTSVRYPPSDLRAVWASVAAARTVGSSRSYSTVWMSRSKRETGVSAVPRAAVTAASLASAGSTRGALVVTLMVLWLGVGVGQQDSRVPLGLKRRDHVPRVAQGKQQGLEGACATGLVLSLDRDDTSGNE